MLLLMRMLHACIQPVCKVDRHMHNCTPNFTHKSTTSSSLINRATATYGGNAIERGRVGTGGGSKGAKDGRSRVGELHRDGWMQFAVHKKAG